jgi:methionine-rich copper-binding protein CopC
MRKLVSLLLIACLSIMSMPTSSAHVTIVSSFPERFVNVNPIPTQVWIQFSGELQTLDGEAVNSLEVIDSTGIAVNFEDPVIDGAKIMTKISGQSAPGVFTVKYRVVGDDGHVIEGDYTFNASPDYAAEQSPMPISESPEQRSIPAGGTLLGGLLLALIGIFFLRAKNRRS